LHPVAPLFDYPIIYSPDHTRAFGGVKPPGDTIREAVSRDSIVTISSFHIRLHYRQTDSQR
jgi:hypothetical protein